MSQSAPRSAEPPPRRETPSARSRFQDWRLFALIVAFVLLLGVGWRPWSLQQAAAALQARRYERADVWLQRSEWLGPTGEVLCWRARLDRKLFRPELASARLEAAAELGLPAPRAARERLLIQAQTGRLQGIEPELSKALVNVEPDSREVCEVYANGLLINDRSADAQAIIALWKQIDPNDPQPYLVAGRWFESQLQTELAEREYRSALHRDPQFAPAHYALGRMLFNGNQPGEAAASFEAAERLLDAAAAPRIGMARCWQQLGQAQRAQTLLERVVALPPAQIELSFALVQDPDPSRPAERLLGELLAQAGECQRALPLLERVLEVEPRDRTLRYLKAQCLQQTDRQEDARRLLEQLAADRAAIEEADRLVDEINTRSNEPMIEQRLRVGELFWRHDSARKAEYWLKTVLARDPANRLANRLLAECYDLRSRQQPSLKAAAAYHRSLADKAAPANETAR